MGKQTYNSTKIYNTVKLRQDVKKKIEKQPKLFFFNILISKILFWFLQFKIVFLLLFFLLFF